MRFIKTIRFKPKPEFLDDFLIEYHKITEAALKDGSIDSYFTAVVEDEIVYIGTFNDKEPVSNTIQRGLDWLDNFFFKRSFRLLSIGYFGYLSMLFLYNKISPLSFTWLSSKFLMQKQKKPIRLLVCRMRVSHQPKLVNSLYH